MLRAINLSTTHRTPTKLAHRARAAEGRNGTRSTEENKEGSKMKNEETERKAYIEFIARMLNERADLRAVRIVYEFVLRLID